MVHAKLRVPLAVEVIDLEAPLFFMFELVEYRLEIATVGTVGGKVLNKFEG